MQGLFTYYRSLLFILFIVFVSFKQNAYGQSFVPSDSLSGILIGQEAKMFYNMMNGDKLSADKMIGEDYVTINADGVMQTKTEMMKTFGKFKGATATLYDKRIRTYGNLSIITGRARFYLKSILVAEVFYTETWVYRNNQFYFIGWQGTMTGAPSYYPTIVSLSGLILLYFIARLIMRKFRKRRAA
ncbi:nuclear transport factor 2 family protein [Mucilaginibacter sp.]|uniref:nuclear transport factor 2 family protein n=1 Tax=Mucilaginibacter sp. TaxID=1882438 RepID=UPI0026310E03|nr:nuclear transport factor 2 family protein [Mucilaginibacter sp.]MDB4922824.1 hypothetical protein [Mucilaginibacter sp.]